jgi:DNA-binding IclR family transcriptional regulator
MLRVLTRVGRRRPAHATSSGKCLLAFGRPADVAAVVAAGFPRLGPRTITSKSMLEKALATVRRTGYAVSIEEAAPDVASVAAPIFDGAGECVAAVSVAGPITRIPQERLDKLARTVLAAAASVSSTSAQSA